MGSTLAELRRAYPQLRVGEFDFRGSIDYGPGRSRTGSEVGDVPRGWLDVRGELDWNWISEVQRALNERAASLVVDGEYGPSTRAAVASFQEANWPFANGLMDPETASALELEVPEDVRIVRLEAGYPGSC